MRVPLTASAISPVFLAAAGNTPGGNARYASNYNVSVFYRGLEVEAPVYSAETGEETVPQPLVTDVSGRIEGQAGQQCWMEEGSYDLLIDGERVPWEAVGGRGLEDFFNDGEQHDLYVYNVEELFDALASLSDPAPYLPGTWIVHLEEGVYAPAEGQMCATPSGLGSRNRVKIMGPDVGGHPNEPVAVIDATNVTHGLVFGGRNYGWAKDIKVINADRVNGGTASSFVSLTGADMWFQNCHSDGKDARAAFFAQGSQRLYVDGGIISGGHMIGVHPYNTQLSTIGYRATSHETAPIIEGTSFAGVYLIKSYADIFYVTVDNCGRGMLGDYGSRARLRSCIIKNNEISGIEGRGSSHFNLTSLTDETKTNTFENNGAEGKGPDVVPVDTSAEFLGQIKPGAVNDLCHFRSVAPVKLTGSTAATILSSEGGNFGGAPPWYMTQGARFRIRIVGLLSGEAGTKTLSFRFLTSSMTSCASSKAGLFLFEAEALFTSDGHVHAWSELRVNGQPPVLDYQDKEFALTGAETLRLYGQLGNAADSIEAKSWEMWVSPPKNPVVTEEPGAVEE